jgi:hypothetical protein
MAPWFKHQSCSDPVVFPEEVVPFFAHVVAVQYRSATGYQPDRVTAGMCVYAKECFLHDFLILFKKTLVDLLFQKYRLSTNGILQVLTNGMQKLT